MYSFIIKEGGDVCSADNSLRPQVGCVQFPDSSLTLRGREALRPEYCEYCEYCEYLGAEAGEGEGWEGAGRGGREREQAAAWLRGTQPVPPVPPRTQRAPEEGAAEVEE